MDVFQTIKRLVLRRKVIFTTKAQDEMEQDGVDEEQVYESIINAAGIAKRLRSTQAPAGRREYLYVIVGRTFEGVVIYTKGKIARRDHEEVFYILISSKKSRR